MPSSVDITIQVTGTDDASSIDSSGSNSKSVLTQADLGEARTPQFEDVPLSPFSITNSHQDSSYQNYANAPAEKPRISTDNRKGEERIPQLISTLNADFVSAASAVASTTATLTAQFTHAITTAATNTADHMKRASIPNILDPLKRRNSAPVTGAFELESTPDFTARSSLESLPEETESPMATAFTTISLDALPAGPSPPTVKESAAVLSVTEGQPQSPLSVPPTPTIEIHEASIVNASTLPENAALRSSAAASLSSSTLPRSVAVSGLGPSAGPGSPSFTSSVRHSPHSTDLGMRSLAQQLVAPVTILKESGSLPPWDAADLLTNADALIHLAPKDKNFPKDVLRVGAAFLDSAISSAEGSIARETAVRDAVEFFAVLLALWSESPYRAKKFVKTLQGGWYKKGLSMGQLADSIKDDRWWSGLRRKSAGATLGSSPKPAVAPAAH
ncbi:hypothetical protein BC829DRAFT_415327 [Chytridium lagenaria]|nr:hypothetical protein BC829DRAFT_415327 [Chytridium lagenaria]